MKTPTQEANLAKYRQGNGEFGTQPHDEAGIVPAPTDPKLRDYGVPHGCHDLDDIDAGLIATAIAYDPDGYAQVSVEVITRRGEMDQQACDYFLGYGADTGGDLLPSGLTKRQTVREWMGANDVYSYLNTKVAERYGCDVYGTPDDPTRSFTWDATEPGLLTDTEITDAAAAATATFRAETDPATYGADPLGTCDPYADWLGELYMKAGNPISAVWVPILADTQLSKAINLARLKDDGQQFLRTSMSLTSWTGQRSLSNVDGFRLEAMLDGPDGERVLLTSRSMITPMIDEPGFLVRRMTNAVRLDDLSQLPVSHAVSSSSMTLPDHEAAKTYAAWANTKGLIEAKPEELS